MVTVNPGNLRRRLPARGQRRGPCTWRGGRRLLLSAPAPNTCWAQPVTGSLAVGSPRCCSHRSAGRVVAEPIWGGDPEPGTVGTQWMGAWSHRGHHCHFPRVLKVDSLAWVSLGWTQDQQPPCRCCPHTEEDRTDRTCGQRPALSKPSPPRGRPLQALPCPALPQELHQHQGQEERRQPVPPPRTGPGQQRA